MSPSWMSQLQLPILHRHDRTNRTGSACAHFAWLQVAHIWKSQGHLAPFLATNVQAAEAQIDVEMGFPAALAEVCYLIGQSSRRGFQS